MPTLRIHDNFLTAAMRIHSVEAGHASHIRYIRRLRDYPVKPWITNSERALNTTFFQNVYRREDNATQNGVNMINYRGYDLPEDSVTEAFDEPLIKEDVQQIVAQFIVK